MEHVTREDIDHASAELEEAKRSLETAKADADEKRRDIEKSGITGPVRRHRGEKVVEDWISASTVSDARYGDVKRAERLIGALRYQRRIYLARCVAEKVLSECAALDGTPCRYKRTQKRVESVCAAVPGASCYFDGDGCIYVRDAAESIYSECEKVYAARWNSMSDEYLFDSSIIERLINDSDGISGELSHVLSDEEVRQLMDSLDGSIADVCAKLHAAHKAARELERSYRVVGLSDYVETETNRAAY